MNDTEIKIYKIDPYGNRIEYKPSETIEIEELLQSKMQQVEIEQRGDLFNPTLTLEPKPKKRVLNGISHYLNTKNLSKKKYNIKYMKSKNVADEIRKLIDKSIENKVDLINDFLSHDDRPTLLEIMDDNNVRDACFREYLKLNTRINSMGDENGKPKLKPKHKRNHSIKKKSRLEKTRELFDDERNQDTLDNNYFIENEIETDFYSDTIIETNKTFTNFEVKRWQRLLKPLEICSDFLTSNNFMFAHSIKYPSGYGEDWKGKPLYNHCYTDGEGDKFQSEMDRKYQRNGYKDHEGRKTNLVNFTDVIHPQKRKDFFGMSDLEIIERDLLGNSFISERPIPTSVEFIEAVQGLSDEEMQVFFLIGDGYTAEEITALTGLTVNQISYIKSKIVNHLLRPVEEGGYTPEEIADITGFHINRIVSRKKYYSKKKLDEIPAVKKCCKCGIEKPIDEFYKDNSKSDSHTTKCKMCINEIKKKQSFTKKLA
jgi:DNA-binding CsgD family transcriptional regulator